MKLKPTAESAAREGIEGRIGVIRHRSFAHLPNHQVLEFDAKKSVSAAIKELNASGLYEIVEPDRIVYGRTTPNDPSFGRQWSLNNTGQNNGTPGADIGAIAGWSVQTDASGVVVAVIDAGINLTHADLAPNLWINPQPSSSGYSNDLHGINATVSKSSSGSGTPTDDDPAGHGSHVSGIIGAVGNNSIGIAGIAWKTQLMALKFLTADGSGSTSDEIACIDYAIAHNANLINASFGSATYSSSEYSAIQAAGQAHIIFVAAAGNNGQTVDTGSDYPAGYLLDNIVAVGATTNTDTLSSYSNFGGLVDLGAPGDNIYSTINTSDTAYGVLSGTSMATPHVTGALALLKAHFPNDSYRQLINRLLRSVTKRSSLTGSVQTGGRLNLAGALTSTDNRPFNDDFASSAQLTGPNVQVRSSNVGATKEPGEPNHAGVAGGHSLWWTWTAPSDSTVIFDTAGSSYDTVLALYTGSAVNSLTPVGSNDDASGVTTSKLSLNATSGTTYQIAVDGKNGATGLTVLKIGTIPANDNFANAKAVTGVGFAVNGTTLNATQESGEPHHAGTSGGHSVWYTWTAPASGSFNLAAFSTQADMVAAVYTGTSVSALTLIASNDNSSPTNSDSLVTFSASAGQTYHFAIDDTGTSGDFVMTLNDSLWQYPTDGIVTSSPAVGTDGTVFFGSNDNYVYALNPDGSRKWRYQTGGSIDGASPALGADGTVYIGSGDMYLYALDPGTGGLKWRFAATTAISSTPAVGSDGTIYFRDDTHLYALTSGNGSPKWSAALNGSTYSSPAIATDGTLYVGATGSLFYAFKSDGTSKWTFTADNDIYTSPVVASDGTIYFATLSGSMYALNPDGSQKWIWTVPGGSSITSSPALGADGSLYFAGYDHKLHALSSGGTEKWSYTAPNEVRASSPTVAADGTVFFGDYDGLVYAINPDGSLKRTYATAQLIRSSPVLAGGRLYFGSNDNKLYAFNVGQIAAASAWPIFHQNAAHAGLETSGIIGISVEPQSQTVATGSTLNLTVTATGSGLSYQWYFNESAIAGATSASYSIANVSSANAGSYTVAISGGGTTVTSTPAVVTVASASAIGRLINLSVRSNAGTGSQTLIVGLVVGGSGSKPLLIRGIGPTLTQYNVTGVLADPILTLYNSAQTVIASNDNWGGDAQIAAITAQVGAFVLPDLASKDSAIYTTVNAGAYTAHVTGNGAASGIALAEVYDASPSFTTTTPQLINISGRTQVGTGGNILIAGFVIGGSTSRTVLIRGIGPTLANYGVTGVLADPQLQLFQGSTMIQQNDNWDGDGHGTQNANTASQVGAFALPAGSKDAELVATLPPGAYTAQVSGVNGTTGVGLVEIYLVP